MLQKRTLSINLNSSDLAGLIKRIEALEKENKYLKGQVKNLNKYADEAEESLHDIQCHVNQIDRYIRRGNVTIPGIPDNIRDNDLEGKVIEALHPIDVDVSTTDIVACHRLTKTKKRKEEKRTK